MPHAQVVPLSAPPASYTAAVERYLTGAGIATSFARIYRSSLTTWGWMGAGQSAPTGPARRGTKPPAVKVADPAPHRQRRLIQPLATHGLWSRIG